MARSTFGGTPADFAAQTVAGGFYKAMAGSRITFWDEPVGGSRYIGLLVDGADAVEVTADALGRFPHFQGPDGVTFMWADTGDGQRYRVIASADNAAAAALAASEASTSATEAVDAAASIVGIDTPDELVAFLVESGTLTRPAVDAVIAAAADNGKVSKGELSVNAADYAPTTAGLQEAADDAAGGTLLLPPGYDVSTNAPILVPERTTVALAAGSRVRHTAATGPAFRVLGVQGANVNVTVNTAVGAKTITAPGHGLGTGDLFRLGSSGIYDASSTSATIGEILEVASVAGDVITARTPIIGGPYTTGDAAAVSKITASRDVTFTGRGLIEGNKTSNSSDQYGIESRLSNRTIIEGVRFKNIGQRHIFLRDALNFRVRATDHDWAVHTTQAYGVSASDACQDGTVEGSVFRYVRHAFTTNNTSGGRGIPRRIRVAHNTSLSTSAALGGSMAGGDAFDTHTAAEDIWFDYNVSVGSSGQGFNMEAASGRLLGNLAIGAASHGIAVHNESDKQGRWTIRNNEARRSGGYGINIFNGTRGTVATYDRLDYADNTATDSTLDDQRVIATVTGSARGYLFARIASDAINVLPDSTHVQVDTEASAATDTLATINGGRRGHVIVLATNTFSRDVTLSQAGNIRLTAAMTLDHSRDSITLRYDGSTWVEAARADHGSA